ncbi:hypothetical protein ACOSQ3_000727 [Xanthoceras sorbifolium]
MMKRTSSHEPNQIIHGPLRTVTLFSLNFMGISLRTQRKMKFFPSLVFVSTEPSWEGFCVCLFKEESTRTGRCCTESSLFRFFGSSKIC